MFLVLVEVNLRPFYLCFCPEFIGAMSQFFVVPKSEEEEDHLAVTKKVETDKAASKPSAPPPVEGKTVRQGAQPSGMSGN